MASLKDQLVTKILSIPGVTEQSVEGREGRFSSFTYKNKDFAHFHNDHEIDLRLTKKIIQAEAVPRLANSQFHLNRSTNSPWIELQFHSNKDVLEVFRWVQLAVQQI